jgi:predicted Zn-dependent protease with MMP-like domain
MTRVSPVAATIGAQRSARFNLVRMREIFRAPLRAAAASAFIAGVVLLLVNPPSLSGLDGLLTLLVAAVAIVLLTAWATVALIGQEMPEPEFRRLVDRSEALAALPPPERPPSEFDELVIEAIDDLPEPYRELLERTPVVVSGRGRENNAYGLYVGGTVARDGYPDRIVIYQDTLERDFGHDPTLLRAQVERTVRHELAHHLGWDEPGVRGLGL